MKNKIRRKIMAWILFGLLFVSPAVQGFAAENDTVWITTTQEFLIFAKKATSDDAFVGKTVILGADISLEGEEFLPIPTFGGIFEGNGHKITGLCISQAVSPAGLFGVLQETGIIKNLSIEGKIEPLGSKRMLGGVAGRNYGTILDCSFSGEVTGKEDVGGIAGINYECGVIKDCSVSGTMIGEMRTGGLVGSNAGTVLNGTNYSKVNVNGDAVGTVNDTGGIAGYSVGMILSCTNEGTVGYPHLGYNVGGIAGRTAGLITNSQNKGEIFGRKDVGGIAGQLEPDFVAGVTHDWLQALREEMDELSNLVSGMVDDAEGLSSDVSLRLTKINSYSNQVQASMENLTDELTDYADGVIREINRFSSVASDVISRMKQLTERGVKASEIAAVATEQLELGLKDLEQAIELLDGIEIDVKPVMKEAENAIDDMKSAALAASAGMDRVADGMGKLENALLVQNEEDVERALQDMITGTKEFGTAMGKYGDAMDELSTVMEKLEDTLKDYAEEREPSNEEVPEEEVPLPGRLEDVGDVQALIEILGNGMLDLAGPLGRMAEATSEAVSALQVILDATVVVQENVSLDIGMAKTGLADIRSGIYKLSDSMDDVYYAMVDMEDMMEKGEKLYKETSESMGKVSEKTKSAMGYFTVAGEVFGQVLDECDVMMKQADELMDYLEQIETLTLEEPGKVMEAEMKSVYDSLDDLSAEMEALNRSVDDQGSELADDVHAVIDQFKVVYHAAFDAVDALGQTTGSDLVQDTSREHMDSMTDGKVSLCVNYGKLNGDTCVGGIIGSMAVENELDPEDDLADAEALTLETTYERRAVILQSINYGTVISKKDYAGGICGKMDLGIVYEGENYGPVRSENGDYIGGVAGFSDAVISHSYAKCELQGTDYVGGILGSGAETEGERSNSVVENCCSMVMVADAVQYYGGIAGAEAGSFLENYFVSDVLQGINRRSLKNIAEKLSYEELLTVEELPDTFRKFYLAFVAEGEMVKYVEFSYDTSFGEEIVPELPQKQGYFAEWEQTEFPKLRFDKKVNAVYTPLLSALESDVKREDGRPLFLVEGSFQDEAVLRVAAQEVTQDGLVMLARNIEETVFYYLKFLEQGTKPEETVNYDVEEQWKLTIPEDGAESHVIRYLPEEAKTDGLNIYVRENGTWKKAETRVMGSYLLFTVNGQIAEILVLSTLQVWWMWLLGGVLGLAVIMGGVRLVFYIRSRRQTKKQSEK